MQSLGGLVQAQKFDEALEVIDGLAKNNDSFQIKMMKLQVLLMAKKTDASVEHVTAMYKAIEEDPATVNMLAWNLYEMTTQMDIKNEALNAASIKATEAAAAKADKEVKASILDTLAHYIFKKGDIDKAIALETEALKLSGPRDREFIENFLEELKAAKAEKEEPKK
jgi:Ni,Fe-hydrogenase I large subunit